MRALTRKRQWTQGGAASRCWFVAGEPATWLGSGYEPWKQRVASAIALDPAAPPAGLSLELLVTSPLRNGQRFDLDNLVTPVFQAVLGPRRSPLRLGLRWWRARLLVANEAGLVLEADGPDVGVLAAAGGPLVRLSFAGPLPADSRAGGAAFVEAVRRALPGAAPRSGDRFGVSLAFGTGTADITWVEERPIKPVVDCLYPILGGVSGAPDDWKLQRLEVRRDADVPPNGCVVTVWRLEAAGGPAPLRYDVPVSAAAVRRARAAAAGVRPAPAAAMLSNGYDYLDEAARLLGSPPLTFTAGEVIAALWAGFPETRRRTKASLGASLDFSTINVRGRASRPGDFSRRDRWNRAPAFLRVGRGLYRRLSEDERAAFARLWSRGEPLLRRESFDEAEWRSAVERATA